MFLSLVCKILSFHWNYVCKKYTFSFPGNFEEDPCYSPFKIDGSPCQLWSSAQWIFFWQVYFIANCLSSSKSSNLNLSVQFKKNQSENIYIILQVHCPLPIYVYFFTFGLLYSLCILPRFIEYLMNIASYIEALPNVFIVFELFGRRG